MTDYMSNKPQNILVLQTAYIGDVVVSTPLIRELHKIFPAANIDIITTPLSSEIFKYHPHIRRIIPFDKKNHKYLNLIKLIRKLRPRNYDCSISIQASLTSALLLYLSNIHRRIGFARQVLTTDSIEIEEKPTIHRSQHILKLLSPLGDTRELDNSTELYLSEKERKIAARIIDDYKENKNSMVIGMAPGSIRFTKQWPEEYYTELLGGLSRKNIYTLLLGSAKERDLCQRIINKSGSQNAKNLAGELSILESSAVIERVDLVLANDSAPLHLANAVNTAVFAFFGPTVRKYGFFPYRSDDYLFEVELDCRPCSLHGGKRCPKGHHKCMLEITPDIVMQKIEQKLNI